MQNRGDMESSRINPVSLRGLELIIIILTAGLVGVLSIYFGTHYATVPVTNTVSQQSGPFRLTLMEIMDTGWNSTIAQPQFSVLGAKGLEPAVNIRLPAQTLIQLTIISYDTPTAGSTDQEGKVTGTVGGTIYLINGTTAMGMNVSQPWGQNVTSVPGNMLAHTFTIQQLGINIPVVGGDTEIAYLYLNQTGTFQWICLTPCGFGPTGMEGAMTTPGWMEGQVTVY
jgi:heme/copper-type cytochrome/quinol oxidase subunit 2